MFKWIRNLKQIIRLGIQQLTMMKQQKQCRKMHHIYKAIKKVGQGNFGSVYLVESQTDNKQYIMKTLKVDRSQQIKDNILKQVKVMKNLHHQYVIRYFQSFLDQNKNVCIVMQYAQNGDLEKLLTNKKNNNQPLKQQQVIQWFVQICLGLKYIHQRRIVHRDLKAENIFITSQNQLKIGDFGISKVMTQTFDMAKTKIGTPHIMAPEIWENMMYNQKSDIWSLGCILYKMMTLKNPFNATNTGSFVMKITSGKYQPIMGAYSEQLKALVGEMLQVQPQKRPSVQKILQNSYIKKNITHVLSNTFTKHQLNIINYNSKKQSSRKSISQKKILTNKRSLSSLSSSIILPKTPNNKENLKMIEYKQSYPILVQENKHLKKQVELLRSQRNKFQQQTNKIFEQLQLNSTLSKEQIIEQLRNHILYYLYP